MLSKKDTNILTKNAMNEQVEKLIKENNQVITQILMIIQIFG